jgi:hypothetical protein
MDVELPPPVHAASADPFPFVVLSGLEPGAARGSLVVVVPAHDEVDRIGQVVTDLRGLAPATAERGLELRVYVVDDGSHDGTPHAAIEAGAHRVLRHRTRRGLGAAVRTGLVAARADGASVAVEFDPDLQHDPGDVLPLIQPILEDEAEIVYGDRSGRRAGSACFTTLMRWLTGWPLRDVEPGILALSHAYLEQFALPGDHDYTRQILLDGYHKGMRFEHVPVRFHTRAGEPSSAPQRYPFQALGQIVRVLCSVRPLRVFAPIGLLFVLLAGSILLWQVGERLAGGAPTPLRNVNFVMGTGLLGVQMLLFGLLADLIVRRSPPR